MSDQKKIVFQGEIGANSHMACRNVYPDYQAVPCPTFEDCFQAVESGRADLAMIPIENSVAGRVADIHHLLPHSSLHIIGEYFLPIRFQLVAPKGATLEGLQTVQSHVMALGQCRKVIRELGLSTVIGADTAGSARQIAERNDPSAAALAPEIAAEIYGLDILKRDVEDEAHNTTRFVILSREDLKAANNGQPVITTFVFRVRNVPAALYKALGGFATNNVNMTKLESYQLEGQFFASMFYADVEGHPDDRSVALALEELEFFSAELKILGIYRASPFREKIREPEANRALRPTPAI
ncbi:prephenate dehydratase [Stappia sp. F7233]|uniref:prephenate dehydratase n=1 Tax=Stappia albiluteola TaxID=2758565 RepID=A0A839A923_9HYPH|nr:prephenate dehydratase [Stappia albiluteola]MBA5776100.1 prephenate dehydratase [Stappia albiluteola]